MEQLNETVPAVTAMTNASLEDQKRDLRRRYLDKRRALSAEEQGRLSTLIHARIWGIPEVCSARTIYSYLEMGREVETRPLLREFMKSGRQVFVPDPLPDLEPASAIRNWNGGAVPLPTLTSLQEIDLFLVPAVVWDQDGYRVGFGGGYFDRLLAAARPGATFIGLGYAFQMCELLPRQPWDVPVHAIVTEQDVCRPRNR